MCVCVCVCVCVCARVCARARVRVCAWTHSRKFVLNVFWFFVVGEIAKKI